MSSAKPALSLVSRQETECDLSLRNTLSAENGPRAGMQPSEPLDTLNKPVFDIETLYNRYRGSLLNYLTGLLPGGQQDAHEIVQETYVRLLKLQDLDKLEVNARAYIFTIATNLVRDSLRKRSSRAGDHHVPFDEADFASADPSPAHAANWEESLTRLKKALFRLSPSTRQIFLLSRFEELTYPEIATALNISTRTVERHMSTAFKALQDSLEGLL